MQLNYKIFYLLMGTFLFADPPDWQNPTIYELTATMTAVVLNNDGDAQGDSGDILAAFDSDGNVRGISTILECPDDCNGMEPPLLDYITFHSISIGGDQDGDVISFQYYDASEDAILEICPTYEFSPNENIGGLFNPELYYIASFCMSISNATTTSVDITYESHVAIAGFQFIVTGVELISGLSDLGGVSIGNDMVLGFSISGTTLPAGSGILVSLEFEEINEQVTLYVSDVVISSAGGSAIPSSGQSSTEIQLSPPLFSFEISTQQAFYFFIDVIINGHDIASDDWVGSFKGETCVGTRIWDTESCGAGVCDLPAMGDDGNNQTEGYMQPGDIPTFKIYDASENAYYDALPSEDISWSYNGQNTIDLLYADVIISGCMDIEACNYDYMATEDDGSCIYSCIGCMDAEACNYHFNFTVDCSDCCEYPQEYNDCFGNYCQGEGEELDCSGECNGSAVYDLCISAENPLGICGGGNSACTDCNGVVNGAAYIDYTGFFIDACGGEAICVGGDTGLTACTQDCAGIWAGSAVEDNCGVCANPENPPEDWPCPNDCDGTTNGIFKDDECGICRDPSCASSGSAASYTVNICPEGEYPTNLVWNSTCNDCNGDINGSADFDPHCGDGELCVGGNTALTACTQDCKGIWGGDAEEDKCDVCCGGTTGIDCIENEDECACPEEGEERDCAGVCGGSAVDDQCGVCSGNNSTCEDCAGVPIGTANLDNCDLCICGNYLEPPEENTGGVCIEQAGCIQDCAGIWGGSAVEDNCGVCDIDLVNDCLNDCLGTPFGIYQDDECGICRDPVCVKGALPTGWDSNNPCSEGEYPTNLSWNSSCIDCNGVINGSANIDPHCGDGELCVGGNTTLTACTQDCKGIWGGDAEEDKCEICDGDCDGDEGAECGNYDCDGNCTAPLDCEYTCGGSVAPEVECQGGNVVCSLSDCDDLDIQPHLLPDKFGINKIFPNPFNPVTQIQYDISAYTFVKIRIFDIRGREVTQLMNQYQNPGQYHLTWDAGNHASGMYIVEMVIRSGDDAAIFRDIRKILYLK